MSYIETADLAKCRVVSGDNFTEKFIVYEGITTLVGFSTTVASYAYPGPTNTVNVQITPIPTITYLSTIMTGTIAPVVDLVYFPKNTQYNYYYAVVTNNDTVNPLQCTFKTAEISTYINPGTYTYIYPQVYTATIANSKTNGEILTIANWILNSGGVVNLSNVGLATETYNNVYMKVYGCFTQL